MWSYFNPPILPPSWMVHAGNNLLLPAFTCLGHKCLDLLSLCDGMHVCTDWTSVYTLILKSFGGMESEPTLTPRENSVLPEKFSPEEDRTHDAASRRTASQYTTNELFRPPVVLANQGTQKTESADQWISQVQITSLAWKTWLVCQWWPIAQPFSLSVFSWI